MIDPVAAWLARLALAGVFASAALHKWRDLDAFAGAVAAHRLVPEATTRPLACALAACESAIAVALLVSASAPFAAGAAAALLALYTGAIAINLARGRRDIDCGCAGAAARQSLSGWLVLRNLLLAAALGATLAPASARVLGTFDLFTIALGAGALYALYAASNVLFAYAPRTKALLG